MNLETRHSKLSGIIEYSVISIIILFTVFSILFQFKKPFRRILVKLDLIGILPNWSFFAPIPGTTDYRIMYCDFSQSGLKSEWQEIDMGFENERRFDFFWNPKKYFQKGIIDLIQSLILEYSQCKDKELIQFSWSYLVLLQIVSKESSSNLYQFRQFSIVSSKGFDSDKELEMVFISNRHKI